MKKLRKKVLWHVVLSDSFNEEELCIISPYQIRTKNFDTQNIRRKIHENVPKNLFQNLTDTVSTRFGVEWE